jgi:hypothetical protein
VDPQAILVLNQRDITLAQLAISRRGDEDRVTIENVGAHALSLHPKLNTVAFAEKRQAKLSEELRILAELDLTRGHGG